MSKKEKKSWQNKQRAVNITVKILVDVFLALAATLLAALLTAFPVLNIAMLWWLLMHAAIAVIAFTLCRSYLVSYHSFTVVDVLNLFLGFFLIAAAEGLYVVAVPAVRLLHAVLYLILFFAAVLGVRLFFRLRHELLMRYSHRNDDERVVIVGAGSAGALMVRELTSSDKTHYRPVAIVDDDPAKQGMTIGGVLVEGTTSDVKEVVKRHGATGILVAIPSASAKEKKEVKEASPIEGLQMLLEGKRKKIRKPTDEA